MKKLFDSWRKSLNEDLCDYNSVSEGWLKSTGELIKLSRNDSHDAWARWYFTKFDELLTGQATRQERTAWERFRQEVGEQVPPMVFLMNELHWVRVANAYAYTGAKMSKIPDEEWIRIISGIYKNIEECPEIEAGMGQIYIYEYPAEDGTLISIKEKNPKRFITALRLRGKIAPSRVAQFRETQEKENLQELQVMGDRESAEYVVAWRAHVWLFPDDDISHMKRAGPFTNDATTIHDLVDDLEGDGRQDVLIGQIDGNRLHLLNQGSYNFDPQSSILVKKLVKALGLSGVSRSTSTGQDYEDEWTGASSIKGKVPDIVYHGTTTTYLPGIMKLGLKPGERATNYEAVDHPEAIFFASRFDEAWAHALHTAKKVKDKRIRGLSAQVAGLSPEPVVIGMHIPDPAKLIPDYDIDQGAEGTNFDYIDAKTREQGKKYGPKMKGKSMSLSQEFGIYGYRGRIPSKFMTEYHIYPNLAEMGVESYEIEKNDIQTVTPRQMQIYLETKEEYEYGYFSYEDMQLDRGDEEEDDDDWQDNRGLDETEEKYLMDSWRGSIKEEYDYYKLDKENPPPIADLIDRWQNQHDKAYDADVYYTIGELWPYREYDWKREQARRSPEDWDQLAGDMKANGWDAKEPCWVVIGKDGGAKIGEGNHRLAIAKQLWGDEAKVPVNFLWYKSSKVTPQSFRYEPDPDDADSELDKMLAQQDREADAAKRTAAIQADLDKLSPEDRDKAEKEREKQIQQIMDLLEGIK